MKKKIWRKIVLTIMAIALLGCCILPAFAADGTGDTGTSKVGSPLTSPEPEDEEIVLDETQTTLDMLGFDTDEIPEGYDPDSTEDPGGGSPIQTLQENGEILFTNYWGNTVLHGHNNTLDEDYENFWANSSSYREEEIQNVKPHAILSAAGDFKGTGRRAYAVYATLEEENNEVYTLKLRIADPVAKTCSQPITVKTGIENHYSSSGRSQYIVGLIDVETGDFDGDGLDEIALFVPQGRANSVTDIPRVAIFKLRSAASEPCEDASWKEVWSYAVPKEDSTKKWNSVDIATGDVTKDGIDDMILSWGRISMDQQYEIDDIEPNVKLNNNTIKSTSVLLQGGKVGDMLQRSQTIDYGTIMQTNEGNNTATEVNAELCRVAFTIGDLDGDGENNIILGGQVLKEAKENNKTRYLGYYSFDTDSQTLIPEATSNMQVVEGNYVDGKWHSGNGFDDAYYSKPAMKANIAVGALYGAHGSPCIYLDSVLYGYSNGQFEIIDELEEKGHALYRGGLYCEMNATSSNFAGATSQGLMIDTVTIRKQSSLKVVFNETDLLYLDDKEERKDLVCASSPDGADRLLYDGEARTCISHCGCATVIDTDRDSAVMHYTGEHYMEYSDPEVLAVLASAPYFEDVAQNAENGGDIKAFSNTAWGQSHGSGKGDGFDAHVQVGLEVSYSQDVAIGWGVSTVEHIWGISFGAGYYYTKTSDKTWETDFTISYSTAAGEDCVALYSIPVAVYNYIIDYTEIDDDGNMTSRSELYPVTIPYAPVTQTVSMKTYNQILAKHAGELPDIDQEVLTSTPGDPASYPSNKSQLKYVVKDTLREFGYDNQYDGARMPDGFDIDDDGQYKKAGNVGGSDGSQGWSAPSYSEGGDVTQTIDMSETYSKTEVHGGYEDFSVSLYFGALNESANLGNSHIYVKNVGTSASGTVYNMVPDAEGYGYYFAWKLVTYQCNLNGKQFPVVTYYTRDVTAPPKLPTDFRQDHENTTESQIGLKWTGKDTGIATYDIYRRTEFPEGPVDVLAGTVNAGDYTLQRDVEGNLVYDENGAPIREYRFIDTGLAEYSEYSYRLQANRMNVPPKSIPTKPLVCKTKALYNPLVSLSDRNITVYYDTIKTVKANVSKDIDAVYEIRTKTYQWQKYNEETRTWENIPLADKETYRFIRSQPETAGQYRCQVNTEISAFGSVFRVTSRTEPLTVKHSYRDVHFGEIESFENGGTVRFTLPITNAGDGTRSQPTGSVDFVLSNGLVAKGKTVSIDGATNTAVVEFTKADFSGNLNDAAEPFPNGVYELNAYYEGDSSIFGPAYIPEPFIYLQGLNAGQWLSYKESYQYGEDLMDSLKLYKVYGNGESSADREDITDQITKIEIVDNSGGHYKDFTDTNGIKTAPIPCLFSTTGQQEPFNRNNLFVKVYIGNEEMAATIRHPVKLEKSSGTIYVDNTEGDAGENAPALGTDVIKIKDALGYEDGTALFPANAETNGTSSPIKEAFDQSADFRIGVYTSTGELLGYTTGSGALSVSDLSPGSYTLKVSLVPENIQAKVKETDFFDLTFEETTLTLYGNTYYVTAQGQTINGRNVGSVSLIAPEQKAEVTNMRIQGGTTVTFKAHPAINYAVKYWIVKDGGSERIIEDTSDTLEYVVQGKGDQILVQAVFGMVENHLSLTTIGGTGCTIRCEDVKENNAVITDNSIVNEGKELKLTATPATGYEFVEWRYVTVDGKTTIKLGKTGQFGANTTTFTMGDVSATIYGVFQRTRIPLTLGDHLTASYVNTTEYNAYLAEGVEVPVGSDGLVPAGATVIIRPEAGYQLNQTPNWDIQAEGVTDPITPQSIEGNTAIRFTLPENAAALQVRGGTHVGIYTMQINSAHGDVELNGTRIISGGTTKGQKIVTGGSLYELKVTPQRGYKFSHWKINRVDLETTSTTYAGVVTGNMIVEPVYEELEDLTTHVEIAGTGEKGTVDILAESPYGVKSAPVKVTTSTDMVVYKGETVTYTAHPADGNQTAYIMIGDVRQEYKDNTYVISDFSKSNTLTFGFEPAVFHKLTLDNQTDYQVTTGEEGRLVTDELALGVNETCELIISGVPDANHLGVTLKQGNGEETPVDCTDSGNGKFSVTVPALTQDSTLKIDDKRTYYIENKEQLVAFLNALQDPNQKINGVLMNDINMVTGYQLGGIFGPNTRILNGTFDGNGYTLNAVNASVSIFSSEVVNYSMIDQVGAQGVIKNLTLNINFSIFDYIFHGGKVATNGLGLLVQENDGTIESCTMFEPMLQINLEKLQTPTPFSLWTGINRGIIRNCVIGRAQICFYQDDDSDQNYESHQIGNNDILYGFSANSDTSQQGQVQNCFMGYISQFYQGAKQDKLFSPDDTQIFENCWFDAKDYCEFSASGCYNVYKTPKDATSKLSSAEVAYNLNQGDPNGAWGSWIHVEDYISKGWYWNKYFIPIPMGSRFKLEEGNSLIQPIRIDFKKGLGRETRYILERSVKTLEKEVDVGHAWATEDACYDRGIVVGRLTHDVTFTEVADPKTEYGIHVTANTGGYNNGAYGQWFKDLTDALNHAHDLHDPTIVVYGDKSLHGTNEIRSGETLMVERDTLTIEEDGSLENNGHIEIKTDSTIENYGRFQNNAGGTLSISEEGEFINAGGFANYGTIIREDRITCLVHIWGDPITTEPTVVSEGETKIKCTVCGAEEIFETIPRVPITIECEKTDLEVGEEQTVSTNLPEGFTGTVTWTSDNTHVATVTGSAADHNAKAVVKGMGAGEATITATYNDGKDYSTSATLDLRVKEGETPEVIPIAFYGASLTLNGDIAVNFYMDVPTELTDEDKAHYSVKLWKNTDDAHAKTVPLNEAITKLLVDKYYSVVSYNVVSTEMTDIVRAQILYDGEALGDPLNYSVQTYARDMLNVQNTKLKDLLISMLNYGASAQNVFNYRKDVLANNILTEEQKVIPTVSSEDLAQYEVQFTQEPEVEKAMLWSASLVLDSQVALRIYINPQGDTSVANLQLRYRVNGTADEWKVAPILIKKDNQGSDLYYGEIPDIASNKLNTMYEIQVMEGDTVVSETMICGPFSYVKLMLDTPGTSEQLKTLLYAIVEYNKRAINYFGN